MNQTQVSDERRPTNRHIRLGRYAGIEVRAHWSLLVIMFLAAQGLALGLLPSALPDRSAAAYWLVGTAAAITFLASVLGHELAHAFTARRHGIPVRLVTLWMLGGVTELDREPDSPRADAAIAASGPAASLAFGGAFAGLAWLTPGPELLTVALAWLAGVNLLLGVFNLLPGAPLDGGRLLRAVLWRHYRDWTRAARASARAGSVLGTVLIALGVLQALNGLILGLWLALIGWFIVSAAGAERQVAAGRRLAGRVVRELMTTPPNVAPSWWTVTDFLTELGRGYRGQQVFPLVDFDGSPRNLLTMRDLRRVPQQDRDAVRLRDAARSRMPALTVTPDTPLIDVVLPLRTRGGIAVVIEDQRVVGTLEQSDVAAAITLATVDARRSAHGPVPDHVDDVPVAVRVDAHVE